MCLAHRFCNTNKRQGIKMKITSLCYIENNNKYLLLNRNKKENDENKGKYIGIGGKFKEGESPFDCVKREVFEETGLKIESPIYKGIVTFVSDQYGTEYMHLFKAEKYSGEMRNCNEGDLCWVEKENLFNYPMWEGDKIFLELMEQNRPFFSLKLVYTGEKLVSYFIDGEKVK
jgi:8-oxo-dGTP diphosphatase